MFTSWNEVWREAWELAEARAPGAASAVEGPWPPDQRPPASTALRATPTRPVFHAFLGTIICRFPCESCRFFVVCLSATVHDNNAPARVLLQARPLQGCTGLHNSPLSMVCQRLASTGAG